MAYYRLRVLFALLDLGLLLSRQQRTEVEIASVEVMAVYDIWADSGKLQYKPGLWEIEILVTQLDLEKASQLPKPPYAAHYSSRAGGTFPTIGDTDLAAATNE